MSDSQKTVTLTLDALKELLKKSESRASLESLLNKKGEKKGEPAPPSPPPTDTEPDGQLGVSIIHIFRQNFVFDTSGEQRGC